MFCNTVGEEQQKPQRDAGEFESGRGLGPLFEVWPGEPASLPDVPVPPARAAAQREQVRVCDSPLNLPVPAQAF